MREQRPSIHILDAAVARARMSSDGLLTDGVGDYFDEPFVAANWLCMPWNGVFETAMRMKTLTSTDIC